MKSEKSSLRAEYLFSHHSNEEVIGLFVEERETLVHAAVEHLGSFVGEEPEGGEVVVGREVDVLLFPEITEEGFSLLFVVYRISTLWCCDDLC